MGVFDLFTLGKVPIIKEVKKPLTSIYTNTINLLDGTEISLSKFKGKKILFVNVASKCGFTNQYSELEQLYRQKNDQLTIIGFPCNQFGYQEKGSSSDIRNFCSINYGVTFPITEKIEVKGKNQHPIYTWLTSRTQNAVADSHVKWNFQKYLMNERGELQAIFSSKTTPLSEEIINAINL